MNLTYKYGFNELELNKEKIKKIFFYRICGTGMGAAAILLKQKGYAVEGGDSVFYPPMSTYLSSTDIPCHKLNEINADYLKKFDLIVVGNVVPGNGDEAKMIENLGVPFASFPTTIGVFVLKERNVIGISGTHGKTTTTHFLSQIFENLGMSPGFLIGGIIENKSSSFLGKSDYFFIESDEYDSCYFEKFSKFQNYCIDHLILTSLEFDHADIFNSISDIEKEFETVIPKVGKSFIFNTDYPSGEKLFKKFSKIYSDKKWTAYGNKTSAINKAGPSNVRTSALGSEFDICLDNKNVTFRTNIIGEHNILNLTTSILFAHQEGFAIEKIQKAIANLKMVKRRQEIRGKYRETVVIDDFAHHPRAVEVTIKAVKAQYKDSEIIVVLDPMSATSRSNVFQKEFAESVLLSDKVVIVKPTKKTTAKAWADLNCEMLKTDIENAKKINVELVTELSELRAVLEKLAGKNRVFLILSNGTCLGLWSSSFINELQA